MEYLLLIYEREKRWQGMSDAKIGSEVGEYAPSATSLRARLKAAMRCSDRHRHERARARRQTDDHLRSVRGELTGDS